MATGSTVVRHKKGVTVRMYRQGLGDCFLLRFPTGKDEPFWMMIDFGIILGTPSPAPIMEAVIQDIIKTTGGEVDVLVATHEHWDHLSGFVQMKEHFAKTAAERKDKTKLNVKQVWFAWTEDPDNEEAEALRKLRKARENALRLGLSALRAAETDAGDEDAFTPSMQVESMLEFFGAAGGGGTTADALNNLKEFGQNQPKYFKPGMVVALKEVPGVRFYVLGPPEDQTLLKKSTPSKGQVYEKGFLMNEDGAFLAALAAAAVAQAEPGSEDARDLEDIAHRAQPFDAVYRVAMDESKKDKFFQEHYWNPSTGDGDQSWRRIDGAWMEAAGQMALQLDSDTNNTSLALAIELTDSGKVLLFPGDAQVGNWLSWHTQKWKVDGKEITAAELLARTVLYKVGHHGSHNATLREKGLELMTSKDLVAMIPVDQKMAAKKRWGEMPFEPLLARLETKAQKRLLRVDDKSVCEALKDKVTVCEEMLDAIDAATGKAIKRPKYYEHTVDL